MKRNATSGIMLSLLLIGMLGAVFNVRVPAAASKLALTNTTITINSGQTYTAYSETQYNLTITTTSAGTTDPSPGTYTYINGTIVSVTAILDAGYNYFDHWELDGVYNTTNPITVTMDMDHTLHAVFTYDATIEAYCYAESANVIVQVRMDDKPKPYKTPNTFTGLTGTTNFTVPETDKKGHLFAQWDTGETSTTITVNSGQTYVAYYGTRYNLTITTTTGGTTDPSPGTHTYMEGTIASVTAIPDTDYDFDHWELDGSWNYDNPISVTMDSNHTLHAVFTYSVTITAYCYTESADVSVSILMDGSPTGYNTPYTFTGLTGIHTFTVPGTDSKGHPFNKWSTGETSTTITVSSGGIYTAYYKLTYTPVDIRDQEHFKYEGIGDPDTVDPAWAYDTASAELIFNVYDTLVFFDRESVGDFIPVLATDWLINQPPIAGSPAGTNSTWYFKIRTGVKFQDGSTLTTEDVEYSFERLMVMDRSGGPTWMINEPLLGSGWPDKSGWPEAAGNPIDTAVESNSTHVWFNLAMPYPPFMQILCGSWASILSKDWCSGIANEWDGDWTNWKDYEDPDNSPLDVAGDMMMGTGPYMLDYWDHGVEYSIVAFNADDTWPTGYDPAGPDPTHTYEYWQGWPAAHGSRYLKRFTAKVNYEWGVRKANFEVGAADMVYVPTAYLPQMILNWPTDWDEDAKTRLDAGGDPEYFADGLRCLPGITTLQVAAYHFNVDIPAASPYVGTGSFPDGIPLDFWSDRRVRQAFAYCFDYDQFLEDMYWDEAEQPPSCVIRGLLYFNPSNPKYSLDLVKAKELFMEASADPTSPAYGVWDQGFTVTMTYNTGNVARETTVTMMAEGVGGLFALGPDGIADTGDEAGGDATIHIASVPWSTYLGELVSGILPFFIYGWLADYPDPHNFVVPYMHTYGDFVYFQHYSNSTIDALIEQGIATPDGPARQAIYETLQLMYFQDCPSVCTASGYGRHWERDWVQGWYHNPIYPGFYAYDKWKGLNGDLNGDNKVEMLDFGVISGHWYPGPPVGPSGYDPIADVWPENMKVLAESPYEAIPKVWDGETETWIPHPSIGAVDIFDASVVSDHWLEQANPI